MFTGIVEELGAVTGAATSEDGMRMTIRGPLTVTDLAIGASIAVNGTCLTAVSVDGVAGTFDVELVLETLDRTSLGTVGAGSMVNLERAMPASGRFDGHIVQGHVDGVGVVTTVEPEGMGRRLGIDIPGSLGRYVVEKGSITVDGVSLTVAALHDHRVEIALIPHTLEVTNLGAKGPGDRVNLEVDILAKYVERLMETGS
ncbi:MAG: riboflavin synthase [Acidimicrobiia bacterium]